ncbi:MAG: hypothetical protein JO076_01300 [Verrucomicrobia bacterium]|nr:hypothetical protein [Verrucomicrobiota bacterium]
MSTVDPNSHQSETDADTENEIVSAQSSEVGDPGIQGVSEETAKWTFPVDEDK